MQYSDEMSQETEYARAIAKLGWNQVEAARRLGINPRTSRRFISGEAPLDKSPTLQRLLRILVALKRTNEWFDEVTSKPVR